MLWIIYTILLGICIISEIFQYKHKTNNNVRTIIAVIIFVFHFISIKGTYMDSSDSDFFNYPISYWCGFFIGGIIIAIVELVFLFKTLNPTNSDKDIENSEKYEEDKDLKKIIDKIEEDNLNKSNIEKNATNMKNQKEEIAETNEELKPVKRFCTKCGGEIEKDWVFCNNCGNKLK